MHSARIFKRAFAVDKINTKNALYMCRKKETKPRVVSNTNKQKRKAPLIGLKKKKNRWSPAVDEEKKIDGSNKIKQRKKRTGSPRVHLRIGSKGIDERGFDLGVSLFCRGGVCERGLGVFFWCGGREFKCCCCFFFVVVAMLAWKEKKHRCHHQQQSPLFALILRQNPSPQKSSKRMCKRH